MIGRIRGIILEKRPPKVLLETNGIGYELYMPITCFYDLPSIGKETIIFTNFSVRKDAHILFGFIHKQELILFKELIKANGVGPKLALAILSGMSAKQFINVVENYDIQKLLKLPGVGKKTAERLIIEMKDRFKELYRNNFFTKKEFFVNKKISNNIISTVKSLDEAENEAISALISLGYKHQEATKLVKSVTYDGADCESLIRDALRAAL